MNNLGVNEYDIPSDTHLLFVEGINGAGKTTYVRNFIENNNQFDKIVTYRGKGIHPVDLSRVAYFTEKDFNVFLNMLFDAGVSEPENCVTNYIQKENDHILVDYLPIIANLNDNAKIFTFAHSHEVYDGFSTVNTFCDAHLRRWSRFGQTNFISNSLSIFEAVTLQYPLMELIAFQNSSQEQILSYVKQCIKSVENRNPMLIYMAVRNIEKNILFLSKERNGARCWIDDFKKWLSKSPVFCTNNGCEDALVIEFFKRRLEIEHYVISHLDIPVRIITRADLL